MTVGPDDPYHSDGMNKNETGGERPRFHTETFEKIDASRKDTILSVALAEFAEKGYNGTSINGLARKAGISIGSLYSYFSSKEDLYLTIVDMGHALLEKALREIDPNAGLFETFAALLREARAYAESNRELNLVYLDAMTQGLRHLSKRLSGSLETITVELYRRVLVTAEERGEIRKGLDLGAVAFCLDNLLLLFQFSFTADYHRARLRLFLGLAEEEPLDEEALMDAILEFARRALRP